MMNVETMHFLLSSLYLYRDVLDDPAAAALLRLLEGERMPPQEAACDYGLLCGRLMEAGETLLSYLYQLALHSDNAFTRAAAAGSLEEIPQALRKAAALELDILWMVGRLTAAELRELLARRYPQLKGAVASLPLYKMAAPSESSWGKEIEALAAYARENGYGRFAGHYAFLAVEEPYGAALRPAAYTDPVTLSDLKDYEEQKKAICENTEALLAGRKASNILLYGDRGTGKSSTVKAVLNQYKRQGLRLIELSKHNIMVLPSLIGQLHASPLYFIIFIDDLSFSEDDDSFSAMKAVLEGSVQALAPNMVIYATSNRRHIVKETFSARAGDEVHLADTMDEAISLSDRFGITLTFLSPNRQHYLDIVRQLAADFEVSIEPERLEALANRWAVRKGGFSPRCARQFIDDLQSRGATQEVQL